ncbi:MAG: hypothetical protein ABW321_04360, partial [Polyangiales bacterium]
MPISRSAVRTPWLVIIGCVVVFIGVRCIALGADPPQGVLGYEARELFVEPPAKSQEARNYALFGAFKTSPADEYQFWRAQSPLWVYPLAVFFKLFGVDYPQLRVFSTLYVALGVFALLLMAAGRVRTPTLAFIGATVAVDAVYLHTSRIGILEPTVSSWLTLSMLALLLAETHGLWLVVAHAAFVLAFFTKQAALFAVPVIAVASIVRLRAMFGGEPNTRRHGWWVLGAGVLLVVVSAIYIVSTDYLRAAVHNFNHVLAGADSGVDRVTGVGSLRRRLVDPRRYAHCVASMGVTGLIASLTLAALGSSALRQRRWLDYPTSVSVGWFGCAFAASWVTA